MRTSNPLVCASASPPSARKSTLKRRRLNHVTDSGRALTDNSNVGPTPNSPFSVSLCAKLLCSTCHRSLSTAIRPGIAGPSLCSKCSAPTCAICARTCTSYTRPASFPPTPALTRSPSPVAYPHLATPASPKRAALGLSHAAAINFDASLPSSIKRKKAPTENDGDLDGSDHHDVHATHGYGNGGVRDGAESVVLPGCGRVVCRTCCVENVLNDGQMCVDCFALV